MCERRAGSAVVRIANVCDSPCGLRRAATFASDPSTKTLADVPTGFEIRQAGFYRAR
jgi:hypothetical protein